MMSLCREKCCIPKLGQPASETKRHLLRDFLRDEAGQDLIEYALIAGLIGLACIAGMRSVTNSVATLFSSVGSRLINST